MKHRCEQVLKGLNVTDLETLLAVAETGSFRRAAIRLGVGQPSVSRRVRRLEDALGLSLFERRPHGARTTEAGARFADSAGTILRELQLAIGAAQTSGVAGTGRLRVGLIASLSQGFLRNLFRAFMANHAGIEVSLDELTRRQLLIRLSHRKIDVVIAAGLPEHDCGDGFVSHHEPIFIAIPDTHDLADAPRISWDDIADEKFIVSAREPGPEIHDYITRSITDLGRTVCVRHFAMGREGIMNLVGLGLGVSLVADHWRGVRYPGVRFVRVGEDERIPFSLTWRPENDNPALRRFISLARIEARKNGALS